MEGEIEARTAAEAEDAIFMRGLTPFETFEARKASSFTQISFGSRKPNAAQIASFTSEFATLEQADVPLDQSLRILAAQSPSEPLRALAQELLARIVDGASLSDALSRRPDIFSAPNISTSCARARRSARSARRSRSLRRCSSAGSSCARASRALSIYPALLITLAIISTGVVLGTLVPSIAPIFADNGKAMPSGLQFILDVQANAGVIGLVFAAHRRRLWRPFTRWRRRGPTWQVALGRLYLRLPVAGPLLAQFATARFSRTLGSMIKAGVPLLQGLESARTAVSNAFLNDELAGVIEAVRGGANLSGALARVPYLPPVATQMITIGEETAQLDDMLLRVAAMFERQTQRSIERAMGLMTPVLTILIAGVVGGLIMTVMDAVLSINDLAAK